MHDTGPRPLARRGVTQMATNDGAEGRLLVVGAGTMGAQIAQQAALNGIDVSLVDVSAEVLQRAMASNRKWLDRQVEKGRLDREAADAAAARVTAMSDLATAAPDAAMPIPRMMKTLPMPTAAAIVLARIGMMNCAIGVYDYNFVSFAAREATRYAAVRGSSSGSAASTTDISNFVIAQSKGLNGSKIAVSTTWSPDNSPGSTVRVQVSYPFTVAIPFMNGSTLNFSSTSQLIITQ